MLEDVERACPLLALAGDRHSTIDGVDGSHRCHAVEPPDPLPRSRQAQLCLTVAHQRCERFTSYVARHGGGTADRAPLTDGLVSTRLLLAPEPAWRGVAGRARRAHPGPILVLGAGLLVAGVGGTAAVSAVANGWIDLGAAVSMTPSPSPSPSAVPTLTPRPSPTATATPAPSVASPSPSPSPSPTPEATAAPTAAPTRTPAPAQQTYVVSEGDTLALIAQQFGTTVEALQSVNGIDDPNQINIGQVLVIP
jgi:LysM repeat protein